MVKVYSRESRCATPHNRQAAASGPDRPVKGDLIGREAARNRGAAISFHAA